MTIATGAVHKIPADLKRALAECDGLVASPAVLIVEIS